MNWDRFGKTVALAVRFLDDVIEVNNYPLPQIEELSKGNRRIGLGVMGWAEALVKMGVPYDSDANALKAFAADVMGFVNTKALEASEGLAEERGMPSPTGKGPSLIRRAPISAAKNAMPRHCARTTIAPTGTIGLAAGLQGAGIEPFFAIAYTRYNAKALDAIKNGRKAGRRRRLPRSQPALPRSRPPEQLLRPGRERVVEKSRGQPQVGPGRQRDSGKSPETLRLEPRRGGAVPRADSGGVPDPHRQRRVQDDQHAQPPPART
jgi:hypothetical protein